MRNLFKFALVLAIVLVCVSCASVGGLANKFLANPEAVMNDEVTNPSEFDNTYELKIKSNLIASVIFSEIGMKMADLVIPNFKVNNKNIVPKYIFGGSDNNKLEYYGELEFSNVDLGKGFNDVHYSILFTVQPKDNELNIYAKVARVHAYVNGKKVKVPEFISNLIPIEPVIKAVGNILVNNGK